MEKRQETKPPEAPTNGRRPYETPTIESEPILEKQLLVVCGTFPRPCQHPPPQS